MVFVNGFCKYLPRLGLFYVINVCLIVVVSNVWSNCLVTADADGLRHKRQKIAEKGLDLHCTASSTLCNGMLGKIRHI